MGKVKVGLYCCLIADILTKVLQKCSLSSPLPNIWILSKLLNLIGCHGNHRKDKFVKKYSKIISSEAIRGMKLKLCRNVHNISLYRKSFFFLLTLLMWFLCYGNLKFPLTYNEKSERIPLQVFWQNFFFYKCLLSSPPPSGKKLYTFLILICCHGNWKSKILN